MGFYKAIARALKKKAIPEVPKSTDRDLSKFLRHMKEALETTTGQRGDPLDRSPTLRELNEAGLVKLTGRAFNGGSNQDFEPEIPDSGSGVTPSKPTNLTTSSTTFTIFLKWGNRIGQNSVAYAEIWRSTQNDIETAAIIGTTEGTMFSDHAGPNPNQVFFYWVRFRGFNGKYSPYNSVAGTQGQLQANPQEVLHLLNAQLSEDQFALSLTQRLDGIEANEANIEYLATVTDDLNVQWGVKTSVDGLSGGFGVVNDGSSVRFYVAADKFYIFNSTDTGQLETPFSVVDGQVVIKQALVDRMTVNAANISDLTTDYITGFEASVETILTNNVFAINIQSQDYVSGQSGWALLNDGFAEVNNMTARGTIVGADIHGGFISGAYIDGATIIGSTLLRSEELIPVDIDGNGTVDKYLNKDGSEYSDVNGQPVPVGAVETWAGSVQSFKAYRGENASWQTFLFPVASAWDKYLPISPVRCAHSKLLAKSIWFKWSGQIIDSEGDAVIAIEIENVSRDSSGLAGKKTSFSKKFRTSRDHQFTFYHNGGDGLTEDLGVLAFRFTYVNAANDDATDVQLYNLTSPYGSSAPEDMGYIQIRLKMLDWWDSPRDDSFVIMHFTPTFDNTITPV